MLSLITGPALPPFWSAQYGGRGMEGGGGHIVPCGKFHRIGNAPPETFPSEKYDAPEEVGGDRKSFGNPIRK